MVPAAAAAAAAATARGQCSVPRQPALGSGNGAAAGRRRGVYQQPPQQSLPLTTGGWAWYLRADINNIHSSRSRLQQGDGPGTRPAATPLPDPSAGWRVTLQLTGRALAPAAAACVVQAPAADAAAAACCCCLACCPLLYSSVWLCQLHRIKWHSLPVHAVGANGHRLLIMLVLCWVPAGLRLLLAAAPLAARFEGLTVGCLAWLMP
jgi:hypothetical protein